MAALTFTQQGDMYVAEQSVSSDFALHLESNKPGNYHVYQKSDPSAARPAVNYIYNKRTEIDEQYIVRVPATITIKSTVPITYGSIIEE